MIALLTAVPEEATFVKARIEHPVVAKHLGLDLVSGTLCGQNICLAHSGVGKAAAAAAAITLLNHSQPQALCLFGCGGAYPGSGLDVGDLALASSEIFGDEGVASPHGFSDLATLRLPMRQTDPPLYNTWPTDPDLLKWAEPLLDKAADTMECTLGVGAFVTVSTCTGTNAQALALAQRTGGLCENMEGAAVALACQQLSVPLLEVRGISNRVEDRDTRRWDLPAGMAAAQQALFVLLAAWPERAP